MMKKNEGSTDRAVRVVVGVVAIVAASLWLGLADGTIAGLLVAAVGAVLLVTGVVGVCPAYRALGMNTCRVSKPSGS